MKPTYFFQAKILTESDRIQSTKLIANDSARFKERTISTLLRMSQLTRVQASDNRENPVSQLSSDAMETNPTSAESIVKDDSDSRDKVDKCTEDETTENAHEGQPRSELEMDRQGTETGEERNDSSTFSTAFTISFEDEANSSKKLTIKDSIRKFAPPKPNTIEKLRQQRSDQCQDNSLASIESAPPSLVRHSTRKGCSSSSRSSSRKSNSSRHSNLSESAAFLIDKMLNHKKKDQEASWQEIFDTHVKTPNSYTSRECQSKRMSQSNDNIVDREEERSDNGTYIVGADPESDAARKKIDELFGVVKAAETSVKADSTLQLTKNQNDKLEDSRKSRTTDRRTLSRERQEHINRLANRNSSISRSSSSSRKGNNSNEQNAKTKSHSRNSSCDRASKPFEVRPRRSASQSSKQSSNKEISDGDTRSSRSSLHNDTESVNYDQSLANNPSMKFNRAFALRRARLGLGEPTRALSAQIHHLDGELSGMSSSQRRHQLNTQTYQRANQRESSSGSANFCREDGGRFSLRMKNNVALAGRLGSAYASNRSPQHSSLLESYVTKVSSSKIIGISGMNTLQEAQPARNIPKQVQQSQASASVPYQSGDELEPLSPSRYRLLLKSGRLQKKGLMDFDIDSDSYSNRINYPIGIENDPINQNQESRAGSSASGRRGSTLQLGALDSLVISAISSLSLKIRHSVCDVLVKHAKKLPVDNETRLIVEEILPQLTASTSCSKSPTSVEEIDQSLYHDLAKTLKNLKKVEQMVDVITLISNQLPTTTDPDHSHSNYKFTCQQGCTGRMRAGEASINSELNNMSDLSSV